jgi:hypothetical protein
MVLITESRLLLEVYNLSLNFTLVDCWDGILEKLVCDRIEVQLGTLKAPGNLSLRFLTRRKVSRVQEVLWLRIEKG